MAAIAGLRGTGDWGTDERPKNFRDGILWMNPNGDTPLLGLSSRTGSKAATDDPEFSWWNEPQDLIRVKNEGEMAAGDTLVTIDSTDPDASNIKQNWGLATHLVPGDILMVEPVADAAADTAERVVVTSVISTTQFTISRGAFGTTPAVITDEGFLLKIGTAFAEGTPEPKSTSRNPIKFFNYTQIFKTAYELTNTAKQTRARTGDAQKNDKKRRSFDHAKDIEMAMLWGKRSEGVDPVNGKPVRTMGGIRSFIPAANTKILTANWGLGKSADAGNNLLDALSPVFDYVSPAGDTRIAFVGNGALNAINRAIISGSGAAGIEISMGLHEKAWGMNFRELLFPQGRLLIKTHPLLSRHSLYTYSMWILDFSVIKYVPMRGRDTKPMDEIQNKGEDLVRGQWLTECSLMVDYAGQTLGYIGGFNSAIA